jgi:hypothetical protein
MNLTFNHSFSKLVQVPSPAPVSAAVSQQMNSEPQVMAAVQDFQVLNPTTEAINGRSAMLGFVAAVISEELTHHSIWSQVSKRLKDDEC